MEAIQEQLVDIGINVVEFILAAGIGILLYSAIQGRRKPVQSVTTEAGKQPQVTELSLRTNVTGKPAGKVSFVSFDQSSVDKVRKQSSSIKLSNTNENKTTGEGSRRNRKEIIRIARCMLETGSTNEKIKQILPISEGELALLQNGIR